MAAVIAPQHQPAPDHRPRPRPALRVIDGERRAGDPLAPSPRPARQRRTGSVRLPARVYRERRIAAAVGAAVLLAVLVLAVVGATSVVGALTTSSADAGAPAAATVDGVVAPPAPAGADQVWVVQPGETLWTIAAELRPDGDVRELVDVLAERAGGASLQAGQRIPLDGLLP